MKKKNLTETIIDVIAGPRVLDERSGPYIYTLKYVIKVDAPGEDDELADKQMEVISKASKKMMPVLDRALRVANIKVHDLYDVIDF